MIKYFIEGHFETFDNQDGTTLKQAWDLYKAYVEQDGNNVPLLMNEFREELKEYFNEFYARATFNDVNTRSVYKGFRPEKLHQD